MIKAILFDISGVLYVDNQVIEGAVEAVQLIQQQAFPIRFVTNSSRSPSIDIFNKLKTLGFDIEHQQIFSAPTAIKQVCQQHQLRPYCLIHPNLTAEFAELEQSNPNAVVVTDAPDLFDYQHLNQAFSLLIDGAPLLAVGMNRYFKSDGNLQLDAGPFIHALEYAAEIKAEILGKPSASFFHTAVDSLGVKAEEVLMIGDDVEADVLGALQAGLQACLVRTGKFLAKDEQKIKSTSAYTADSVVEAIEIAIN